MALGDVARDGRRTRSRAESQPHCDIRACLAWNARLFGNSWKKRELDCLNVTEVDTGTNNAIQIAHSSEVQTLRFPWKYVGLTPSTMVRLWRSVWLWSGRRSEGARSALASAGPFSPRVPWPWGSTWRAQLLLTRASLYEGQRLIRTGVLYYPFSYIKCGGYEGGNRRLGNGVQNSSRTEGITTYHRAKIRLW